MKLFVYIVLAVVAFELALAFGDKKRSIAGRIRNRFPNQRILMSDNSRLFDMGQYTRKVKSMIKKILKEFRQPIFMRKGHLIGTKQQWDVKYGK